MVELGAPRIALEIAAETREWFTMLERASGRKSRFVLQGPERPVTIPIGVEDLLHVYPTMAEALTIFAISRFKDRGRLSCCAE